jgi:hypothetical protein
MLGSSRVFENLRNWLPRKRPYAGHFDAPTKARRERLVLNALLDSMEVAGEREFSNPRPSNVDPPDCVVDDIRGGLVAVELTELVSGDAIRANKDGRAVYRDWMPNEVAAAVEDLLLKKDGKKYLGGPYSRLLIVVHTAEPVITCDVVVQALNGHVIRGLRQVTDAMVVMKYEGGVRRCPYLRLAIERR